MGFSPEDEKVYKCLRCGAVFSKKDQEILPGFRCPHCGFKIIEKIRPSVPKRARAL